MKTSKKNLVLTALLLGASAATLPAGAQPSPTQADSLRVMDEVVVTGTRNATDVRHLSQTVSIVDRRTIEQGQQPNLLPVLSEQVPGLFVTARGVMGYGISGGAAYRCAG